MTARPSRETLALALYYINREYTLKDGPIDGEILSEGLAFGPEAPVRLSIDDLEYAENFARDLAESDWWNLRARADVLRAEYNFPARYRREGACVCSRELLSRVSCRCRYRSIKNLEY